MRIADAPLPGWYPDPAGGFRLRWWDGLDWTDDHRARPGPGSLEDLALAALGSKDADSTEPAVALAAAQAQSRRDTEEIIAQVRDIARSEVDRAAEVFSQRAESAARQIQPLISEYTTRFTRWVKLIGIVAALVLVTWFVFQFVIQASFLDWLGDRIDNLTDD